MEEKILSILEGIHSKIKDLKVDVKKSKKNKRE